MSRVCIVRAAHLLPYINVLRDAGISTDRQIVQSGLPTRVEEMSDEYLSLTRVLDFVGQCSPGGGVMAFGYRTAEASTLATLSSRFQLALLDAPSGLMRLRILMRGMREENSALRSRLVLDGVHARLICDLGAFRNSPGVAAAEWVTINAVVRVMHTIAGPGWAPSEITFTARQRPSDAASEAFGNTRILIGQPVTSITIPLSDLPMPCARPDIGTACLGKVDLPVDEEDEAPLALVDVLRRLIRPYIGDGSPNIDAAAEIVGMSQRSLQRHLAKRGRTYSDLLVESRYDIACDLLADPSMKVIDVAMAAGYGHPQHFSRAFRQIAGISPRAYREQLFRSH